MKLKEIKAKMPIDKLWMQKSRVSQEYDNEVLDFLDFVFSSAPGSDKCFVLISMPNSIPKRRNYGRLAL